MKKALLLSKFLNINFQPIDRGSPKITVFSFACRSGFFVGKGLVGQH
jgi:hypothetical protein